MSKDLTQYVTTKEAAELLGVDRTHVNHLLRENRIKGIKLGWNWLVFKPSLGAYLETKDPKGRPPTHSGIKLQS